MRSLLSLLVVASSLCVAGAADDTPWYKVISKEGGMAAMIPGKATPKKIDGGEQYILEADNGDAAYLVQWNKLPAKLDITDANIVKELMDGSQKGLLEAFEGAKLISSEDFEFDEYPARAIDVNVPKLGIYRVDVICDGKHLYQVTVLGNQEFVDGDDATAFMQSFRLLEE